MKIPEVGSQVRVTVRQKNIYYYTYREQPFVEKIYEGTVVKRMPWVPAEYFAVKTGNPSYPTSLLRLEDVVKVDMIAGKQSMLDTFLVAGSKGNTYVVTREGNHYSCTCQGFTFRGKCKHANPEAVKNLKKQ